MKYNGMPFSEGRTKSPCMTCEKHSETCRRGCEPYKEFVKIHEEERRQIHQNRHKYMLGYGAKYRSERELQSEAVARRQRKAKVFKQTMK